MDKIKCRKLKFNHYILSLTLFCTTAFSQTRFLVEPNWLKKNLTNGKLLLIDVREPSAYTSGHIKSAINISVEYTFDGPKNSNKIISPTDFKDLLSKNGVKNDDYVIFYDSGNFKNSARFFWVMETYGHQRVSILDGGLAAWKNKGYKLTKKRTIRPTSNYIPVIKHQYLTTKLNTRIAIKSNNTILIDARSNDEYQGFKSQAYRSGHIPKAINFPWKINLDRKNSSTSIKKTEDLKQIYKNIAPDKQIIAYCNRGKESAVSYLSLRILGYKVSIYDGAWLEWGNDPNMPIEN